MNRITHHFTKLSLIAVIGLLLAAAMPALAQEVTDANLADKVAAAKTSADHQEIANYYHSIAKANAEKVKTHEAMLAHVTSMGGKPAASWTTHCKSLISAYKSAEKQAEAMAKEQEGLAKKAK